MRERPYQPFSRAKMKDHREPRLALRTPAQKAATERNFRIMRMRSLWCLAYILSPAARAQVQAIIDADLKSLGARTTQEQSDKVLRQYQQPEIPF